MANTRVIARVDPLAELSPIDLSSAPRALLAVLHMSSFGLAVFNRRLTFVGVNPALAEMNGLPETAHRGKKISQVLGRVARKVAPLMKRVISTGQPIRGIKLSAKLPARREKSQWVEDFLPLADYGGKVRYVAALVCEVGLWAQRHNSRRRRSRRHTQSHTGGAALSPREVEIVRLLAKGRSNKEVSSILGISVKTVETHRTRILLKLDLKSLVDLVHYAFRNHLVEPSSIR
jgi:DNA-binding CsgD family transcriptional regulator